ncbi:Fructosamine-3-kinase [Evansella caseinilytica]|uniref:Fructosamine-3-kinase n=1 Tax=Evansella caseinilytica TaxID=1503961 RepID=A0A1H3UFL1_9BACI|nr:aminoglycoside phosphotransferase family protein [Evansella caseinilytica]SDZ61148.1 Fructosamine-3-kinase [Evansella caseinilytica]
MESLTKISVTEEMLEAMVHQAFGPDCRITEAIELGDGWYNTAFAVLLEQGKKVVLKVAPPTNVKVLRYERNIMQSEGDAIRTLRTKTTVPMPEVLFYDDSLTVIDSSYFFTDWLDGLPYNKVKEKLSEDQRADIEEQLGRFNREINGITGDSFGYFAPGSKRFDNWSSCFQAMISDLLQDAKDLDVNLPLEYEAIQYLVDRNLPFLENVHTPCLVHWDLWDGNFFVNDQCQITGIIDFERTLWADPLMEVYFGPFNDSASFCRGYGANPLQSKTAQNKKMLYNLYLHLILFIESFSRGYSDEHKHWALDLLRKNLQTVEAL